MKGPSKPVERGTGEAPEAMGDGRIAVSIVSWNTCDLLRICLHSLFESCPEDLLEVFVVDNGSVDGSAEMVEREFPAVTLLRNAENEGFARANNQAFAKASAPYFLLLNSDTDVRSGALLACRDHLRQHREVGAVGCRIESPDGTGQSSIFRYPSLRSVVSTALWLVNAFPRSEFFNHDRYGSGLPAERVQVEVVMGSFLMVRSADFDGALLDDGFFMYAEEADLCRRIAAQGRTVEYLPEVSVRHVAGASSRTSGQKAWSHEAKKRAQLRFLRKWDGPVVAYVANVAMLVGLVPRAVGWALGDAVAVMRGGRVERSLRSRAMGFHVLALFRPGVVDRRFSGPPADLHESFHLNTGGAEEMRR